MAIFYGVTWGVIVVLAIAFIALYRDVRGEQRALAAWQSAVLDKLDGYSTRLVKIESAQAALLLPQEGRIAYASPPSPRPPPNVEGGGMAERDAIERRYEELRAKVRTTMGLAVDHCQMNADGCDVGDENRPTPAGVASAEWRGVGAVGLCQCECEGCRRATACWLQAQREVARAKRRGE